MRLKLSKNLATAALGVVALSIWAHNAFTFFTGVKTADEPAFEMSTLPSLPAGKTANNFVWDDWRYEARYRDPFQSWLFTRTKTVKKKVSKPQNQPKPGDAVRIPSIRLTGIIRDTQGSLAVIEDENRQTAFARKGDTVNDVQVVAVDSISISCVYKSKKFVLELRP